MGKNLTNIVRKHFTFLYILLSFLSYSLITTIIFKHRIPLFFTHYAMPDIDTEGGLWYQWFLTYIHKHQYVYDVINLTGYPFGFDLAFSPVFNLIYTIQVFILNLIGFSWNNLILIINISSFLVYPLSALGASLLCYYLTRNKVGSFIAGLVYAFSFNTVLWGRGQMSINHTEMIPLYFLSLFYYLDRRNMFSLVLSITLFGLLFKADAYYAFFSGIFTVPIILFYHKETIQKKIGTFFSYYIPLFVVFFLLNINFILSNLYLFNKSQAVLSGRNSLPQNELLDIVYHFSMAENSYLFFHFGNYSHIFSGLLTLFLIGSLIVLRKKRLFLTLFSCFLLSILLSSYIPNLFFVNEIYFKFFSMFRSVARINVHTTLFLGLLFGIIITYYMNSLLYTRIPQLFSYTIFTFLGIFVIFTSLTSDGSWYKSTSFSSIEKLYSPLKNNSQIHAISAYPLVLNNGDNGFPPTYQLMGQIIHERPLTAGLSPFADENSKAYYQKIKEITSPTAIDTLTYYGVDTILIYNKFEDLELPAKELNEILKNDERLTFIGRYTAPKDPGYLSMIDRSKDISVYQIKKVVEENATGKRELFSSTGNNKISYKKISAAKYHITIEGVTEKTVLVFNTPYSDKWRLYPGDLTRTNDLLFLRRKNAVVERVHANEYANGWVLDPRDEVFKQGQTSSTTSAEFTLYFQPEAKRLSGMLITLITLISLGIYIAYTLVQRREKKKK